MSIIIENPSEPFRPDPKQPRKSFLQDEIQKLADSIKELGLLQPILVAPDGVIIAGQRRWLACKLAGVPCRAIVVDADEARRRIAQLAENLAREALEPSEIVDGVEEAVRMNPGVPGIKLAQMVGLSTADFSKARTIAVCQVARPALADGTLHSFIEAYAVAKSRTPEEKAWRLALKAAGASSQRVANAAFEAPKPEAEPGQKRPGRVPIPLHKSKAVVTVTADVRSLDGLIALLTEAVEQARKALKDGVSLPTARRAWADKAGAK